jgi:uncharacterized membrane protein YjjP (DUF1212 family)
MSEGARMTGFDAVVRVANLALQSSGEGVETLERYVARTASAYGIAVDVAVLPEQIIVATQGRPLEGLLPFLGAFVITTLGLTTLPSLVESTGVTLIVLPALFITVPGDTLSAAAAELLGMRLTAWAARLVFAF